MKVLSLFDGMSCGRIALDQLGIPVEKYYASEIDKYAMKVSEANYPDIIQVGDILNWKNWDIDFKSIDLVSGGFPCQSWSLAGKQLGDKDERGMMFWVMLEIMQKVMENNPNAYYLMENVRMKKEFEEYITTHTENALPNVNKYCINSALVSAQNRVRYYWTNIPGIEQPEQRGIVLRDILETEKKEDYIETHDTPKQVGTAVDIKGHDQIKRVYSEDGKSSTLTTCGGGHREPKVLAGAFRGRYDDDGTIKQHLELRQGGKTNSLTTVQKDNVVTKDNVYWRKLTPVECERLQTVPDDYTNHVSNSQRYKMLGNGMTVEVIKHIFQNMEVK